MRYHYMTKTWEVVFHTNARASWRRLKVHKHRYHRYGSVRAIQVVWGIFSLLIGKYACELCQDTGTVTLIDKDKYKSQGAREYYTEYECQDCCEHQEYDHGVCLYCGKDCIDALVNGAEDYYEGDR